MTLSGTQYQCVAGETYDIVSLIVYGDESHACDIMNANPELITIPVFTGGGLLELPELQIIRRDDGEYMPEKAPWKE